MSNKESLTFESINDLHKHMEKVAILLDGFVLIIYAIYVYYILMEISRANIHIQY